MSKKLMSRTRLYFVWRNIRQRCRFEYNPLYKYYGARGIDIYDEWYDSFPKFKEYVIKLKDYEKFLNSNYTIDRIDNNKGYYPDNLKWSSKLDQVLNRRPVKNKTGYTGITMSKNGNYVARVHIFKKEFSVGTFETLEEAVNRRNNFIIEKNLPNKIQKYKKK